MVDIVLVNWNSGEFLYKCLNSGILEFEIVNSVVVVDNNSEDNSLILISSLLTSPKLKLFKLDDNIGFARACNLGANNGTAEYLLFLNTDTIIDEISLIKCKNFLKSNLHYGACSVQIKDENLCVMKSCSNFLTPSRLFFDSSLLSRTRLFHNFGALMRNFCHQKSKDVEQVIGAFIFLRKFTFQYLNGFDDRFFVYYEDMDLCHRIHLNGEKIRFLADCSITHYGGKSSEFNKYFSRN